MLSPVSGSPALPLPKHVTIGQKFGHLTVVDRAVNDASARVRLNCVCECGVSCVVRLADLKSGHTKSCGCERARVQARKFPKMRFRRFGAFGVLGTANGEGRGQIRESTEWIGVCAYCGKIMLATGAQIRKGNRRCPCMKETYSSWRNMIQRTTNPNHDQYEKNYGGADVKVHPEWRNSFIAFLDYMGKRPKGKTLDRIDPFGDYVPGNVTWATPEEQANNRRPRGIIAVTVPDSRHKN